jgi:putative FmdB family regulatory protein
MPLYEYYCTDCKIKFEALRPMSKADAPIQCKNCESVRTSRALSVFAAPARSSGADFSPGRGHSHGGGGGCCGGACGCGH